MYEKKTAWTAVLPEEKRAQHAGGQRGVQLDCAVCTGSFSGVYGDLGGRTAHEHDRRFHGAGADEQPVTQVAANSETRINETSFFIVFFPPLTNSVTENRLVH